ncbi:MAG: hypothetical protein R3209_02425 [Salinimicrobium sediminis]|uniref:tRNA (Guanine-N1)-methyltransferase n=1 Tax=Salinimicrobium sediminis TaxID=1343891 RepID=A0A285X5J8_9FLAO|nr:hypothetical protein [Salinimicrobium sediminis]MDX1601899.1 hypothetical protein [Salinimicrobium sediminis]SOC80623.1 hypothetical protein SAMN06296241_2176 [Salinimicrobium sediminis]
MNKILFSSLLLLYINVTVAQVSTETTIDEKFQELITNSNNFKGYKVVDTDQLTTLQKLTSNRIAELKEEIAASKQATDAQEAQMAQLRSDLESMEAQLNTVTSEKDNISFLGMSLSKAGYNTTMWSIIGVLVLALALFVVRFKRSHIHTTEARKNLNELEKEFDAYRVKALEKEQRLGRLLQDEKNKQLKLAK